MRQVIKLLSTTRIAELVVYQKHLSYRFFIHIIIENTERFNVLRNL